MRRAKQITFSCFAAVLIAGFQNSVSAAPAVMYGVVSEILPDIKAFSIEAGGRKIMVYVDSGTKGRTTVQVGKRIKVEYEKVGNLNLAKRIATAASASASSASPKTTTAPEDEKFLASGDTDVGYRFMDVVVTGIGKDSDLAKQNAYAAAIERTLGVLVDANTLVENDKLVRDEVLTFSKGELKSFDVLEEWKKGGLTYVQVKAVVPLDALADRLKTRNITTREVPGGLYYRDVQNARLDAENARKLLTEVLQDFRPDRLIEPRIVGEPRNIGQDELFVTMEVNVTTMPNAATWKLFYDNLHNLLMSEPSVKRDSFEVTSEGDTESEKSGNYGFKWSTDADKKMYEYQRDGKDWGYWLMLLKNFQPSSEPGKLNTIWMVYPLGRAVADVFENLKDRNYQIRVMLLDGDNRVLAERDREIKAWRELSTMMYDVKSTSWKSNRYHFSPFFWGGGAYYSPSLKLEPFEVDIPLADLKNVSRVVAKIERIQTSPEP
jgi:hypothetical protein